MPDTSHDLRAPMPAAPIRYLADGSVDWGNMWDSFCVLAADGGPPHRATMLNADERSEVASAAYAAVIAEIVRGIEAVSGLQATAAQSGWVAIACSDNEMAAWLAAAIEQENVSAHSLGATLFVPAGEHFGLKTEIKNVITAVAKTTHYWQQHLPPEVKIALLAERHIRRLRTRLRGWLRADSAPAYSGVQND